MTMIAVTETKALNTLIAGVKTSGKAFEAKLHLAAFSCITIADGGDIRPLARLYAALNGRVLKTALASWANTFGKVKIVEATAESAASVSFAKTKESDLVAAQLIPVADYKPEVAAGAGAAFDFAAKLKTLIKNADKNLVSADPKLAAALEVVRSALPMIDGTNVIATSNLVTEERDIGAKKAA